MGVAECAGVSLFCAGSEGDPAHHQRAGLLPGARFRGKGQFRPKEAYALRDAVSAMHQLPHRGNQACTWCASLWLPSSKQLIPI